MSTSAARHARTRRRPLPRPRSLGQHDHLLLVTHHYEPETGAPQRRWGALVPRLVGAGFRVSVLAPPPHYPSGVLDPEHADLRPGLVQRGRHGERILRVRYREHSSSLVSRTADHVVAAAHSVVLGWRHLRARAHRPTVVVGTVPGIPSMFAAWALARLFRARFVVEMRDAWPDLIRPAGVVAHGSRSRVRAALVAVVHRAIIRLQTRSDLVVTTTETFAGVVESRGAPHVGVVRNGTAFTDRLADDVDDEVDALPDDDARRLGPARPLRVVYVGTIGRSQGLEVAVQASAALAARGVPVEVHIAGAGADVPHLTTLAAALGAPVTFLGRVPHTDVPALYAWADTVLVSLRDWEPFEWTVPSKLYETMATRRHITACVAGEAAELVLSLEAGDVVPPGDVEALAALWAGFVAAGAVPVIGHAAQEWVALNADDDALAARYVELLDGLRR
ncbi:glycosyltransferase family 4 protein [Cellulosimicrobium cellulans]|uniref:glycosyltransferase family 4 protein n=1 Tax=Cellulosimicrobium cellulans TaxID=1710 RepID=UPI0009E929CA|nr:glycosyltransferase family 4 protein [Cellulosimicrobium cellulans]